MYTHYGGFYLNYNYMKLYKINIIAVVALALVLGSAGTARAQDVSATIETDATVPAVAIPTSTPRAGIRAEMENRKAQGDRPLEKRIEMRKETQADIKAIRVESKELRSDMKLEMKAKVASSSHEFKREVKNMRVDLKKKMEVRQFEARKAALIKELNASLSHITDISTRIEARIVKTEAEGRNMTEPRALLVIAKEKLEKAKLDVNAFASITASSTVSANATTTVEVDLAKPRQIGDAAIKSVKEARDAFQKVVTSIAHNMGKKTGVTATTTIN